MTPRTRKLLAYGGYPTFYVMALLVFVDLTFPNADLARFIESEFNSRQLLGSGVKLDVGRACLYWLSGVELQASKGPSLKLTRFRRRRRQAQKTPPRVRPPQRPPTPSRPHLLARSTRLTSASRC